MRDEAGGRRQRRFSNYLLDRAFQLKYVGMILGLSTVLSVGLGYFLVRQMRENSRLLSLDPELDPVFQAHLAEADAQVGLVLVGALVAFNVLLGLGAVVVTHRMAGPIFVFRRYLAVLAEGRIPEVRPLRRGDEFSDVLEQLRATIRAIQSERREVAADAERLAARLAEGADPGELSAEVDRLRARARSRLEADG